MTDTSSVPVDQVIAILERATELDSYVLEEEHEARDYRWGRLHSLSLDVLALLGHHGEPLRRLVSERIRLREEINRISGRVIEASRSGPYRVGGPDDHLVYQGDRALALLESRDAALEHTVLLNAGAAALAPRGGTK